MRRYPAVALVLLVGMVGMVGCGEVAKNPDAPPGTDPDDGARSGTRLKIEWWETDDGFRHATGRLHDTMRDEACVAMRWSDGVEYCTPTPAYATFVYTDAACTQGAGTVPRSAPQCPGREVVPDYFYEYDYSTCEGAIVRMYHRGTQLAATQFWSRQPDGTCVGPMTDSNRDIYATTTELATSELVPMTRRLDPTTGRLAHEWLESADGLHTWGTIHDTQLADLQCYPYFGVGLAAVECMPTPYLDASDTWADASCSVPLTRASTSGTCGDPRPAHVRTYDFACPNDPPRYFDVGAQVSPASVYVSSFDQTQCVMSTPTPGYDYFQLGAAVDLATLTRGQDDVAGQRLQLTRYTLDGFRARERYAFDSQLGTDCLLTDDGVCVPIGWGNGLHTDLFTDNNCSQPVELYQAYLGVSGCIAQPLPPVFVETISADPTMGECDDTYRVVPVISAHTDPLYQIDPGLGSCVPYVADRVIEYDIGPAMSTPLARAARHVDP